MRPQQNAADHDKTSAEAIARDLASMRPQQNAADHIWTDCARRWRWSASMRPQQNAADHGGAGNWEAKPGPASMRPQQNAADHSCARSRFLCRDLRFNEAAAKRCGSHPSRPGRSCQCRYASMRPQQNAADHVEPADPDRPVSVASMRPQQNAADHTIQHPLDLDPLLGFNEAAAKRCGSQPCRNPLKGRQTFNISASAADDRDRTYEYFSSSVENT